MALRPRLSSALRALLAVGAATVLNASTPSFVGAQVIISDQQLWKAIPTVYDMRALSPCKTLAYTVDGPGELRVVHTQEPARKAYFESGSVAPLFWYNDGGSWPGYPWAPGSLKVIDKQTLIDGKVQQMSDVEGHHVQSCTRYGVPAGAFKVQLNHCPHTWSIGGGAWVQFESRTTVSVDYARGRPISSCTGMTANTGGSPTGGAGSGAASGGAAGAGSGTTVVPPGKTLTNVALRKPATQSSIYRGTGVDQGPHFGVDGIYEGQPRDPYLMVHTNTDNPSWWQVDLLKPFTLVQLKLYNRKACCQEKARTVQVMLSNDGSRWETVYAHNGTSFNVLTVDLKGRQARYVRLQLAEVQPLFFQEVEVFGY